MKEDDVGAAVERVVVDLRYGSIGVNVWHGLSFAMGSTTWGAYPGDQRTDIQSGTGVVGNAAMFDRPEKSVVRGPFRSRPKPPWFATAPESYDVMRRFVAFEAEPSAAKIRAATRRHAALTSPAERFSSSSLHGAAERRRAPPPRWRR